MRSPRRSPRGVPGDFAEAVLDLVAQVPSGCATTYGEVAERVGGGGARAVGGVMARFGGDVPWWRVVRADGTLAEPLLRVAEQRWAAEGTPVRAAAGDAGASVRVDLSRARWEGPESG